MDSEDKINKLIDEINAISDVQVEDAGLRFEKRLKHETRKRFLWKLSYAAMVILIVGVSSSLFFRPEEVAVMQEIPEVLAAGCPDVYVPTLVLSDGNEVDLKNKSAREALCGQEISLADNHLVYDAERKDSSKVEYNTLVIPAGYTYRLTLSDGSSVIMNAGSSLHFPKTFAGKERCVELKGEAFFQVAKSPSPFIVKIGDAAVRVYGTEFNVKAMQGRSVETVLVEGSVGFSADGIGEIRIEPGEAVSYQVGEKTAEVSKVDVTYATSWLNGYFKYRDKPLDLILEDLSVWYGVRFETQINVSDIELTMSLDRNTPLEDVISFIKTIIDCEIVEERGYYILKKE